MSRRAGQADMAATGLEGPLGRAPRTRRGFALTPLADIMFQLLIFFMLSSSLAPYALLPLSPPARAPGTEAGVPPRPASDAVPQPLAQAIWHLERGAVRAGDIRLPFESLPEALSVLRAEGISDIVVFISRQARAQDLADLLVPVRRAGVVRLQLIGR
ncbi:MAG: hypothetical protein CMN17_10055 [Roseovarius sp.]|nr:hypothetical protein [Roseovarius sp.]MBK45177.1 hypothetical protein [Roseovarius sp.]|tara:strand:- start:368 stop:841 length:474 start_codon:yes stop_codon:yes gene_type:complete